MPFQLHHDTSREKPVILGHESTGLVIDAGKNVVMLRLNTVLVTWVPRDAARAERPAVAATLDIRGQVAISKMSLPGRNHRKIADEQYVVVDADIPTDVTSIIGCAVMTGAGAVINTAKVGENERRVFGVGGVGLSAIVGAKVAKAHPIIAIDLDDQKAFAKKFGATHTINAKTEDPVAGIHKLTANESGSILGVCQYPEQIMLSIASVSKAPWNRSFHQQIRYFRCPTRRQGCTGRRTNYTGGAFSDRFID